MDEPLGIQLVDITEASLEDQWLSPMAGSLIGAASADALGWITWLVPFQP
jgi:hypothetical protein